jgi:DNA-binding transcriptional regulator GbsR (MarR family)
VTEARDPAAVSSFIERFAQVMVDSGMPRIASRIFVSLVATDSGSLTAAELAEQHQASAGAISQGVRYLVQLGLISRGRRPGSRRDYYRVSNDVWYRTISQRDQILTRWTAGLQEGADVLGPETAAGARFAESVQFFTFMENELRQMLERWEVHRARLAGDRSGTSAVKVDSMGDQDLLDLRARAASGDQDAVDQLVELTGERGDLDELRRLAAGGSTDAVDQLVELAGERGDLDELRRLAAGGSRDAADVLTELSGEQDDNE